MALAASLRRRLAAFVLGIAVAFAMKPVAAAVIDDFT
jgi:hypothetical protein